MSSRPSEIIIGYSAYDKYEQCYEYVENSCFIADNPGTLRKFTENCWQPAENCEKKEVRLSDILADFGVSGRRYAMEPAASERFGKAAGNRGIRYESEPYKGFSDLLYVEVEYRQAE